MTSGQKVSWPTSRSEVDPDQEIGAICHKVSLEDGPALLFERVKGSDLPHLTNVYGTRRRIARAFGCDDYLELAELWSDLISRGGIPPTVVSDAPCQEVVLEGNKQREELQRGGIEGSVDDIHPKEKRRETMTAIRFKTIGLILVAISMFGFLAPAQSADKVEFGLDWIPYGAHAPYFAGKNKGFYKEAGIDINITRGYGSRNALKALATKKSDFVLADPFAIYANNRVGNKAKSVAIVYEASPLTIVTLKSSGIKHPRELDGKRLGDTAKGAVISLLPAFSRLHGNFKVNHIVLAPALKNPSLLGKKVDAIGTYQTTVPVIRARARKKGDDAVTFNISDYGLDIYGLGIVTSDATIKTKPGLVKRLVAAHLRSVKWAAENRKETVTLYLKSYPTQSRTASSSTLDVVMRLMLTKAAARYGLGYMQKDKMQRSIDLMAKAIGKAPLRAEDVYTNDFLPKPGVFVKQ